VESTQYLRLLRRNWFILVTAILVGVCGSYLLYRTTPAQYRSTVVFNVVSAPNSKSPGDAYQAELLSQARTQIYRELPYSQNVAEQLGRLPGVGLPPAALQSKIVATTRNTLIQFTVTDTDQRRATALALGLETVLPADVAGLQSSAGQPVSTRLQVFGGLANAAAQVGASRTLYLGLGLFAGLILGLLGSVVRERCDHRVRDEGDVRAVVGGTTVGFSSLSRRPDSRNQRRLLLDTFSAPVMAAVANGRPIAVVPLGRADTAARHITEFGAGFAGRGQHVAILDCDVLEHWVSQAADMADSPGLTDILEGNGTVASSARRFRLTGLRVVPAGDNPYRFPMRSSEPRMADVLAASRQYADLVLLATPPLLSGSAVVWPVNASVDAILFVERHRISSGSLRAAVQVLGAVNAKLVGIVLFSPRPVANGR
jgi:Mrp family chromosome partitioning ATPase/capsular polysaccharide biosynthesis protein